VISQLAGNGRLGWIPASATSLTEVGWRIYVSIDRQQITVFWANELIRRIRTSTGVPGATTPTGRFAVTDRLRTGVQEGPYGCCILALSGIQPLHLSDWDGGNRIAIHATDDTAALGHPASHGCAHVDDTDGRWLLAHIPDGTPVVIANAPFHRGRGSPA
jgi:lipoprotein-anchoring transpeptidase ErfK/SrfK